MNAPFPKPSSSVAEANLSDPGTCARIDAFLADQAQAEIFHRPQWSRAVERGCRQRSRFLVAEDGAGRLTGCFPLTEVRSFLFGYALVSVGFGTGGGILAASAAVADALAGAAVELARRRGCASVETRGGELPSGWERRDGVYAAFARPAEADPEALLLSIPRKQRAEVRKALAAGLEVCSGRDMRHVDAFCRIYAESVRNLGTPVFPRALFSSMIEEWGEDADVLLVSKDGRPLAAHLNFYWRGSAFTYWGGGTADARRWRANDLLYFALIRHSAERGCAIADFGRSKVGSGAWERKRIWGFEERPLVYAAWSASGTVTRDINPTSGKYRSKVELWRKLPLPVANRLGPMIARGLG